MGGGKKGYFEGFLLFLALIGANESEFAQGYGHA